MVAIEKSLCVLVGMAGAAGSQPSGCCVPSSPNPARFVGSESQREVIAVQSTRSF
ncbi:hypothetical protein R69746_08401 [Paraburkholderia aspalathi]|nr:hypothetical protein R69746_08401 [Paraburkholderia aspalathi]